MSQVVKFFGWLVMAIGATLAVFSYITIGFVYGLNHLTTLVSSAPLETALSVLAVVPGMVLYGFGVLLVKWSRRSDQKWQARKAAAQAEKLAQTPTEAPPPDTPTQNGVNGDQSKPSDHVES